MNTQEKIDVMQAYINGKSIEYSIHDCNNWFELNKTSNYAEPAWNWEKYDYRIKNSHYLPYENTDEMIIDYCKRFEIEYKTGVIPTMWIVDCIGLKNMIVSIAPKTVYLLYCSETQSFSMDELLSSCRYIDGSLIGKSAY